MCAVLYLLWFLRGHITCFCDLWMANRCSYLIKSEWIRINLYTRLFQFYVTGTKQSHECQDTIDITQGIFSLSGRMSHLNISWSLEAARVNVIMIVSREIWQASRQGCSQGVCQISERLSKPESRGFMIISKYLTTTIDNIPLTI